VFIRSWQQTRDGQILSGNSMAVTDKDGNVLVDTDNGATVVWDCTIKTQVRGTFRSSWVDSGNVAFVLPIGADTNGPKLTVIYHKLPTGLPKLSLIAPSLDLMATSKPLVDWPATLARIFATGKISAADVGVGLTVQGGFASLSL
jgi:hypothetical protein